MTRDTVTFSAVLAVLSLVAAPATALGEDEFEVFDVFAELNDTDGDLGLHFALDGGPWTFVTLKDASGHFLWTNRIWGRLRQQGGTEIFFESAEPPFESAEEPTLTPEQFFSRFPEGEYQAFGRTQDGGWLVSTDDFNHLMPAPPAVMVNGAAAAEDCDVDPLPQVPVGDVVLEWGEVTTSHPDIGATGLPIDVSLYQAVAEIEVEMDGEEFVSVFSVDIEPPEVTSMTIPEAFVALAEGEELKFEVVVKEAEGGNQTAVESCVEVLEQE